MRSPGTKFVFWSSLVATTVLVLGMIEMGVFDSIIPKSMDKDEAMNQVLNVVFTFLAACYHPKICIQTHMLYKWNASDQFKLRQAYCRNWTRKPDERSHMAFVLLLFHVNCISQYVICFIYLRYIYRAADRPRNEVQFWVGLNVVAAIVGVLYRNFSPLGRDFEIVEPQSPISRSTPQSPRSDFLNDVSSTGTLSPVGDQESQLKKYVKLPPFS